MSAGVGGVAGHREGRWGVSLQPVCPCLGGRAGGAHGQVHRGGPGARTWTWLRSSGARATSAPQALLGTCGETPADCDFSLVKCSGKIRSGQKISLLSNRVSERAVAVGSLRVVQASRQACSARRPSSWGRRVLVKHPGRVVGTWPPGAEGEEARPRQVQVRTGGAGAEGRGLRSHLGALSGPRACVPPPGDWAPLCEPAHARREWCEQCAAGSAPRGRVRHPRRSAFCLFPEVLAEVFPLTDSSEALA